MDIKEKEAIERQFERNLDLLVRKKFPLTATAIVAAEQPMILLFKELIHRIEKRELELDKKDKIINAIKNKLNEHIKFCEQETNGSLNNEICHISLKFDKSLLDIIES